MILERYIQREILEKLAWLIGFLILILTSHRFVDYLADAAAGKLPADLIMKMLMMKMLAITPRLMPIALFLSVVLALTRLSGDKELVVMTGSGVDDGFQLTTVSKLSFLYALLVFVISFFVSPWAENHVEDLKARARQESDIAGISAGRFKEFSKGDRIVYVKELSEDRQSMNKVFLQVRQDQKLGVLTSDSARFDRDNETNSEYILFENGSRYVGEPGMLDYQITDYRYYGVLVDEGEQASGVNKVEAMSSLELMRDDKVIYKAELQWRLSFVIASILLPLLAVALNKFSFGENRYVSVMIGILIYLIYSNLLGISKTLIIKGNLYPIIGLWWTHVLLLISTFIIFKLHYRSRKQKKQVAHEN